MVSLVAIMGAFPLVITIGEHDELVVPWVVDWWVVLQEVGAAAGQVVGIGAGRAGDQTEPLAVEEGGEHLPSVLLIQVVHDGGHQFAVQAPHVPVAAHLPPVLHMARLAPFYSKYHQAAQGELDVYIIHIIILIVGMYKYVVFNMIYGPCLNNTFGSI